MNQKKQIRTVFRTVCFKRDKDRCCGCGCEGTQELTVHHITDRNEMPGGGYVAENGITLCPVCHVKAEQWHISAHTEWVIGFNPDDLYGLIGSDFSKAYRASEKLV